MQACFLILDTVNIAREGDDGSQIYVAQDASWKCSTVFLFRRVLR